MEHQTTSRGETTRTGPLAPSSTNGSIDSATLELLARWRVEDATNNPEAIQAAEKEVAEFKAAMNDNRTRSGESLLFP